MFVTIRRWGDTHYSVYGPGRSWSGFASREYAARFCDVMGWTVVDDPATVE